MSSAAKRLSLTTWVPGIGALVGYQRANLPYDLTAGLVVVLVLIPSAIAYADLANCPPLAGLYAALGGMVAFALFTSTRHVIAGPDAAIAILVGAAIGPLSAGNSGQALVLSTWLALLAACILLGAAWLKLGGVAEFLSIPVMLGFMNGAAVVIIGSQIGKLTGIPLQEENTLFRLLEWVRRLSEIHGLTLTLGLAGMAILVIMKMRVPKIPGTIVVFVIALVAGRLVDFAAHNVSVIGTVDTKLPDPVPPRLSLTQVGQLVTGALGLALLIFPQGILLGRVMAARHKYELRPDQELLALGMANLAAGIFRSFAVGASQSRTLLNSATGGRTQLVSFIAAVLLIGFMVFLATWIATMPTVAIAAILTFTGFTLIDLRELQKLYHWQQPSALVSLLTTLGVVALGVLPGILVGIILSLLKVLSQVARPQDALLGRISGQGPLHDVGDDAAAQTIPGLVVYRFYGPLFFANIRFFIERIEHFMARETHPVKQVILDARAIPDIDVTAAEQLHIFVAKLHDRGIRFVVAKAHLPLREAAASLGMKGDLPQGSFFARLSEAVAAYEAMTVKEVGQ